MRLPKLPLQDISNIIENRVKLNRTCDACSDNTKIYGQKVSCAKAHATPIVKDIEYTAAITMYTWRRARYVIRRRSYIPQRCQLIGRFCDHLQFLAIKDLYSQISGDLVDKKDEKAVAQFMMEDLYHIDVQMTMDAPDHPDGSISHGGYHFNYSKQYTLKRSQNICHLISGMPLWSVSNALSINTIHQKPPSIQMSQTSKDIMKS